MSSLTNKQMKLSPIFPRTIGVVEGVNVSKEHYDFLTSTDLHRNIANDISKDTYLLERPEMCELKRIIEECLAQYVENTFKPVSYTTFKMTQSWINVAQKGEAHHRHAHPNSLISGCLYLSADRDIDKIIFYRDNPPAIHIMQREMTVYNSDIWHIMVGAGDLIFFPSCLPHSVPPNERDEKRISLAFNVFADGILGGENSSTELKIRM